MPPIVHGFDWPDRFVIGTVGQPGSRTFFMQARAGSNIVSVSLEKDQSAALAERIEEVLDELMGEDGNPYSVPALTPEGLVDNDPLELPIEEQFRAGVMSLGWDPTTAQVVIEAFPIIEVDVDELDDVEVIEVEPEEAFIVRIPVGTARAFAKRTREIVGCGPADLPAVPAADGLRRSHLRAARRVPVTIAAELVEGDLELSSRILSASNATFLAHIGEVEVVYKPIAGERPLWDFPDGNLAHREVAAYAVSEVLGWDIAPPTWLRDGPLGPGMVQLWQETDPTQQAVTLVAADGMPDEGWCHVFDGLDERDRPVSLIHEDSPALRRMAVFDIVVNNADRKGGHVLEMTDGHRHGVDHGLTFHTDHKLRTVLWGWLGLRPHSRGARRRRARTVSADRRPGRHPRRTAHRGRGRRAGHALRAAPAQGPLPGSAWRHARDPVAAVLRQTLLPRAAPAPSPAGTSARRGFPGEPVRVGERSRIAADRRAGATRFPRATHRRPWPGHARPYSASLMGLVSSSTYLLPKLLPTVSPLST